MLREPSTMPLDVRIDLGESLRVHDTIPSGATVLTVEDLLGDTAAPPPDPHPAHPAVAGSKAPRRAQPAEPQAWEPRVPAWLGTSQLLPQSELRDGVDPPPPRASRAVLHSCELARCYTALRAAPPGPEREEIRSLLPPYFVPPTPTEALLGDGNAVLYQLDDDDVEFAVDHGLPLAAVSRVIGLLETAYARELLAAFDAETVEGRAFSENRSIARGGAFARQSATPLGASPSVDNGGLLSERQTKQLRREGFDACPVCTAPISAVSALLGPPVGCRICGVHGHQHCLLAMTTADWTCDVCWRAGTAARSRKELHAAPCGVCGHELSGPALACRKEGDPNSSDDDGPAVATDPGKGRPRWCHAICAHTLPRTGTFDRVARVVTLKSNQQGDAAPSLSRRRSSAASTASHAASECAVCSAKGGAAPLMRCAGPKCTAALHAACAVAANAVEVRSKGTTALATRGDAAAELERAMTGQGVVRQYAFFCPTHVVLRD